MQKEIKACGIDDIYDHPEFYLNSLVHHLDLEFYKEELKLVKKQTRVENVQAKKLTKIVNTF